MRPSRPHPRFGLALSTVSAAALFLTAVATSAAAVPRTLGDAPSPRPVSHSSATSSSMPAASTLPQAPLFFIENRGQRPADVRFYGGGGGRTFTFTAEGLTVTTVERFGTDAGSPGRSTGDGEDRLAPANPDGPDSPSPAKDRDHGRSLALSSLEGAAPVSRHTVQLHLVGARHDLRPVGDDRLPTLVSYFKGPRANWHTGLATYGRIVYPQVWPGVDLEFTGTARGVLPHFVLSAGADASQIQVAWRNERGECAIASGPDALASGLPALGPDISRIRSVGIRSGPDETGSQPAPERSDGLADDPVILAYAGYFGYGGESDRTLGVATDIVGQAYVTGQIVEDGQDVPDAYIAKVQADGNGLDFMSVIGGDDGDAGFDIDVDHDGNSYITGYVASEPSSFPATVGPNLKHSGVVDILVAKLDAGGQDLLYAGYLGGELIEFGEGIRVDDAGNVYLHGIVLSSEATFPVKVGPDLTFNQESDGFLCKVKADPSAAAVRDNLVYCGYIGGDAADIQMRLNGNNDSFYSSGHIAIDSAGALYVSGETTSPEATFPDGDGFGSLAGPDHQQGGNWDAYLAKVKPDGSGLAYATYIGGDAEDFGKGMSVDAQGNAYLTGGTRSTEATLPVTVGPDLTHNGALDALVAKMKPDGSGFAYLGFLGGKTTDDGEAVVVDSSGRLTIAGYADSLADTFPVKGGPDLTQNDAKPELGDAWVARIKADPRDPDPRNNLDYAGYIGGADVDQAFWVDIDSQGNAFVIGDTQSDEKTFPNGSGFGSLPSWDTSLEGVHGGFLAKVQIGAALPTTQPTARPTDEATPTRPAPTPTTTGGSSFRVFLPVGLSSASLSASVLAAHSGIPVGPGETQERANLERSGHWDPAQGSTTANGIPSPKAAIRRSRGEANALRSTTLLGPVLRRQVPDGGLGASLRPLRSAAAPSALQLQETSYDDFCDFGIQWASQDDVDVKAGIFTDKDVRCFFRTKILTKNQVFGSVSNGHRAQGDFALETTLTIDGKGTLTGLLFGVGSNFNSYYLFVISEAGDYIVAKSTNGSAAALVSGPADVDTKKPVTLMVAVQGTTIQAFINGNKVDEVTHTGTKTGRAGVYTEWNGTGASLETIFDNLRISRITGSSE